MSNNAFLQLIRQYAALARRKGASFAEPVDATLRLREKTLAEELGQGDELTAALAKASDAVQREYGKADPTWATYESKFN